MKKSMNQKLIDFCINNQPELEGCDIVDYVYVLFKCSQQTNYKKNEINTIFNQLIKKVKELYISKEGGFSYFKGISQTHYYGAEITKRSHQADIHGTLLVMWGLAMIIKNLESDIYDVDLKIIKP